MRFFAHPALGMHRRPENLPPPLQGTEPLSESAWRRSRSHRVGCCSNENANRLIRRWFPKGTDFSKVTAAQIAALQDWINNYPRKVLNWSISNTVYELYMQQE
nr:MAG TPA: RNaseH [Caudoviricetes sp.]